MMFVGRCPHCGPNVVLIIESQRARALLTSVYRGNPLQGGEQDYILNSILSLLSYGSPERLLFIGIESLSRFLSRPNRAQLEHLRRPYPPQGVDTRSSGRWPVIHFPESMVYRLVVRGSCVKRILMTYASSEICMARFSS